jgi:anti-sigma factor RsiW
VADTKPLPDDAGPPDGPTEELTAYLDGELDPKAAESMATKLSLDPKLRAEADALQRAWDILDVLPRPQPSATFTTRTVSQVIPVPASLSGTHTDAVPGSAAPTMPAVRSRRTGPGFWLGSMVLVLAAGAGGYLGHRAVAPAPRPVTPEPPLEDVTLLKNLRLYRHVDDIDYLKKLDSPELFGDESE